MSLPFLEFPSFSESQFQESSPLSRLPSPLCSQIKQMVVPKREFSSLLQSIETQMRIDYKDRPIALSLLLVCLDTVRDNSEVQKEFIRKITSHSFLESNMITMNSLSSHVEKQEVQEREYQDDVQDALNFLKRENFYVDDNKVEVIEAMEVIEKKEVKKESRKRKCESPLKIVIKREKL